MAPLPDLDPPKPKLSLEKRLAQLGEAYRGITEVSRDQTVPAHMRVTTACFGAATFTFAILAICGAPLLAHVVTAACFIACAIIFYLTRPRAGPRHGEADPP